MRAPMIAAVLVLATAQALRYRVDGTVGVDVGRLGAPAFGPMTLFSGELRAPAFECESGSFSMRRAAITSFRSRVSICFMVR